MTTIIIEIRDGPNHDSVLRQVVQSLVSIGGPLDFRANDLPDRSTPPGWGNPVPTRQPEMDMPGERLAYTLSSEAEQSVLQARDHATNVATEPRDKLGRRIGKRRRANGHRKA